MIGLHYQPFQRPEIPMIYFRKGALKEENLSVSSTNRLVRDLLKYATEFGRCLQLYDFIQARIDSSSAELSKRPDTSLNNFDERNIDAAQNRRSLIEDHGRMHDEIDMYHSWLQISLHEAVFCSRHFQVALRALVKNLNHSPYLSKYFEKSAVEAWETDFNRLFPGVWEARNALAHREDNVKTHSDFKKNQLNGPLDTSAIKIQEGASAIVSVYDDRKVTLTSNGALHSVQLSQCALDAMLCIVRIVYADVAAGAGKYKLD